MDINIQSSYQNITTVLNAEFQKGIDEAKPISAPLAGVINSSGKAELHSWLQHVPGLREWYRNETRVIRNVESADYYVANRRFENTIAIEIDDVEDNQLGQYRSVANSMGQEAALLQDRLIFELFTNGHTTNTLYDSVAWFGSHTVGLSTVANTGTGALSSANFTTGYETIRGFTVQPDDDSTARPLNNGGKYMIVVPPQLEITAREILLNERDDAGATNTLQGLADIMVSSWLTSALKWYLCNVGASIKPTMRQVRMKPQMLEKTPANSDMGFNEDRIVYGIKCREAGLSTFPWLAYGSTGAA